jgi:hypothetical protein
MPGGVWWDKREVTTMSITIDLPPDTELQLRERAEKLGQDPAAYIIALLDRDLKHIEGAPRTLAEAFAGRLGLVNSGGLERLSEDTGEKFADYLEQKRREEHL